MSDSQELQDLRKDILGKVEEYYNKKYSNTKGFAPGDRVPYAGRVFDASEMKNLVNSSLDFWLTQGPYTDQFENNLSKALGVKFSFLVNSGSSANLLAFWALTSPLLKDRQIKRGDEVITVACGFPTTVAPIIQYGAIPVFVDVEFPTINASIEAIKNAITSKTKAIFLAHTLGNPFDIASIKKIANEYGLWLIEDNCDALGSEYSLDGIEYKMTGSFADIGTSSFYPPHHITMGEGGAVYTSNSVLKRIILSLRDWGRDCWCPSGVDNTCGKRFNFQLGSLPKGYDHKYTYSHFGFNLKATDLQASIGVEQLKKLSTFTKQRRDNWNSLNQQLEKYQGFFDAPQATINSKPSWFGYSLTLKDNLPFTRKEIVSFLESKNIQTRMLFAGNLIKHPCFNDLEENKDYRIVGNLENTDKVMNNTLWLGVYPGLKPAQIEYISSCFNDFLKKY